MSLGVYPRVHQLVAYFIMILNPKSYRNGIFSYRKASFSPFSLPLPSQLPVVAVAVAASSANAGLLFSSTPYSKLLKEKKILQIEKHQPVNLRMIGLGSAIYSLGLFGKALERMSSTFPILRGARTSELPQDICFKYLTVHLTSFFIE